MVEAPLVTALAFQAFISALFALLLYIDLPAIDFAIATLAFSAVLGLLTLLGDLGGRLRDPRHTLLVAHLPVSRGTILRARFAHAALYLTLLALATALPPAILGLWVFERGLYGFFAYLVVAWHQALLVGFLIALLYGVARWRASGALVELGSGRPDGRHAHAALHWRSLPAADGDLANRKPCRLPRPAARLVRR